MRIGWAIVMGRQEAAALGRLRTRPRIEVHDAGEQIWLRGEDADDSLIGMLRRLPGAVRSRVLSDGQLVPDGARVPRGVLPPGEWTPLDRWLVLEPQPAAFAAGMPDPMLPRLVPSPRIREPQALLIGLPLWREYAEAAPAVRLGALQFAASADGRVLVQGSPLPPLPGERLVEQQGIARPCGLEFSPTVEPAVLRELLGLEPGDWALFAADGSFERIAADQFVRATRSAVRMTARGVEP